MMDVTERLREYVGFPLIGRGQRGRLIQASMRDAEKEITELRTALRRLAIRQHVRMASGGGTVPNGGSCALCDINWPNGQPEGHRASCLLARR